MHTTWIAKAEAGEESQGKLFKLGQMKIKIKVARSCCCFKDFLANNLRALEEKG